LVNRKVGARLGSAAGLREAGISRRWNNQRWCRRGHC